VNNNKQQISLALFYLFTFPSMRCVLFVFLHLYRVEKGKNEVMHWPHHQQMLQFDIVELTYGLHLYDIES
jgi:hypothetical protein